MSEPILITGAAGFIGSTLVDRLLSMGRQVVGIDNFDDFYDPAMKRRNVEPALRTGGFELIDADICNAKAMLELFKRVRPHEVIHLAAKAGVRNSILDPVGYATTNVNGTVSVLAAAAQCGVERVVFASSSSVYGNNPRVPFAEDDPVDAPISPYAATKRSAELLCHSYWHVHQLPITCLRFFTVFGPRQRPDLAIGKFLRLIDDDAPIPLFGDGSSSRDYTYVDDIIDGTLAALDRCDGFGIYNLGGSHPVALADLITVIENVTHRQARIESMPAQTGDVERTYADLTRAQTDLGYEPKVSLEQGIARQWAWMKSD